MHPDTPAGSDEHDLSRRVLELERELAAAQQRESAAAAVLRAISGSPNVLQPVLDAIVQTANSLCASDRGDL
jgi:hypothetical protein